MYDEYIVRFHEGLYKLQDRMRAHFAIRMEPNQFEWLDRCLVGEEIPINDSDLLAITKHSGMNTLEYCDYVYHEPEDELYLQDHYDLDGRRRDY
jgi:hypothetical protein